MTSTNETRAEHRVWGLNSSAKFPPPFFGRGKLSKAAMEGIDDKSCADTASKHA